MARPGRVAVAAGVSGSDAGLTRRDSAMTGRDAAVAWREAGLTWRRAAGVVARERHALDSADDGERQGKPPGLSHAPPDLYTTRDGGVLRILQTGSRLFCSAQSPRDLTVRGSSGRMS